MKRHTFLTAILALFLSFGMVSCENNDDKPQKENKPFVLSDFSHSECKNQTKGTAKTKEILVIKADGKKLNISHINTIFNCCPDELIVKSERKENTVIISEDEKENGCKCLCPYDLKYKIGELPYGKYHFVLKKAGKVFFKFDLDFSANTDEVIEIR